MNHSRISRALTLLIAVFAATVAFAAPTEKEIGRASCRERV